MLPIKGDLKLTTIIKKPDRYYCRVCFSDPSPFAKPRKTRRDGVMLKDRQDIYWRMITMNTYGRILMALGLVALIGGALVDDFIGLSTFWHGVGYGMGFMIGLMFIGDLIKNSDEYFG